MRKFYRVCAVVLTVTSVLSLKPSTVHATEAVTPGLVVNDLTAQGMLPTVQQPVVPVQPEVPAQPEIPSSGMTYIDVSIDNQTLTYFVNGVPALMTPCVTGGPGRGTPRGVFQINSCIPGKYLTGPTWHVWVNRWMRFAGNCGIHDASWRKQFGGQIYKSNGSHGCVNIPHDQAVQLYSMVGIGTVVIVH